MFTLYCSLLSVQKQYVQNNVHALIKKYFNAKNCWPLSEPSASRYLFADRLTQSRVATAFNLFGKKKKSKPTVSVMYSKMKYACTGLWSFQSFILNFLAGIL